MPPISIMIKPVSGLCNLRCEYCFYADEKKHEQPDSFSIMNYNTVKAILQKLFSFAETSCTITFQGGEPTLAGLSFFSSFLELEKQYNTKRVTVNHCIQTNGLCLDEAFCRFLAENHFLVGLSLDGIRPCHDRFRKDANGNGTYFRTMEAAKLLSKHHVNFNILTVVNSYTAPKIRKIYENYQKNGFLWQQYIACIDPLFEKPGSQAYSLSPKEYGTFLIELFHLWYEDVKRQKQPYIRQFENYVAILRGQLPESCEQRGFCSLQAVIEADGSVYPCDFYVMEPYRLGNLCQDSFEQIAKSERAFSFFQTSLHLPSACRTCNYYSLCRGGCRRQRMEHTHTADKQENGLNYFCKSYQMFFDACLPKLMQI